MDNKKVKRKRFKYKARSPYKRRKAEDILRIVNETQDGRIGKLEACRIYGLNKQTLQNWIGRLSVRNLGSGSSENLLSSMTENQKTAALAIKINELTRELEKVNLKIAGLETMIEVAEQQLNIRIKKKAGTKRLKE